MDTYNVPSLAYSCQLTRELKEAEAARCKSIRHSNSMIMYNLEDELWYIFGDALRSLDKATTTKQFLRAHTRLENAVALFLLRGPNSIKNAVDTHALVR